MQSYLILPNLKAWFTAQVVPMTFNKQHGKDKLSNQTICCYYVGSWILKLSVSIIWCTNGVEYKTCKALNFRTLLLEKKQSILTVTFVCLVVWLLICSRSEISRSSDTWRERGNRDEISTKNSLTILATCSLSGSIYPHVSFHLSTYCKNTQITSSSCKCMHTYVQDRKPTL